MKINLLTALALVIAPALFAADVSPKDEVIAAAKKLAAKVPIEVHLFTKGGHAFNMGNRSKLVTVKGWTNRLTDWLADNVLVTEPVANSK